VQALAITTHFPVPADSGTTLRILALLRTLATHHDVHLLCVRRPGTGDPAAALDAAVPNVTVEAFDPMPVARRAAARGLVWARSFARGQPPWVVGRRDPRLARRVRTLSADADVVIVLDDYAALYLEDVAPGARVLADKHNVAGASLANDPRPPSAGSGERLHRALTIRLARRFERAAMARSHTIVVTSEEERSRHELLYGRAPEYVVPSAIDVGPQVELRDPARRVGWIGSIRDPTIAAGVIRFAEEGWPRLGAAGYELVIAGGDPPPAARALERLPGVRVAGYVPDAAAFLAGIDVAVVPLWGGAGVKLKSLMMMAMGIPLVATPSALEGVAAQHGHHCLVASDAATLADGVERLLEDRELARRMAAEARALVEREYTWASVAPQFLEAVERTAGRPGVLPAVGEPAAHAR
jgi:polysaccharide biosynthesis protein PslH